MRLMPGRRSARASRPLRPSGVAAARGAVVGGVTRGSPEMWGYESQTPLSMHRFTPLRYRLRQTHRFSFFVRNMAFCSCSPDPAPIREAGGTGCPALLRLGRRAAAGVEDAQHPQRGLPGVFQAVRLSRRQVHAAARGQRAGRPARRAGRPRPPGSAPPRRRGGCGRAPGRAGSRRRTGWPRCTRGPARTGRGTGGPRWPAPGSPAAATAGAPGPGPGHRPGPACGGLSQAGRRRPA